VDQVVLPEQVTMAKQLITGLGDFTVSTCRDELAANVTELAAVFVAVGNNPFILKYHIN
jgi:hypothetical protein